MEQEPKYQRVIDWVRENIESGAFHPGDRLMSEMDMSELFGLSRQTIRRATGELVNEGVLTRIQGSGTYIGEAAGPSLRTERYNSIAVISTFYDSYIFPKTLMGIEKELSAAGYTMQVSFTDNRITREAAILEQILEKDSVDGVIVEPAKSALPNPNLHFYRELQSRNIPVLFFHASYHGLDAPCVRMDDRGIAEKITNVLIDAGHKEIAGIFKIDDGQGPLRYAGYLDALMQKKLHVSQHHVFWVDTPLSHHLADLEEYLLKRIEGCTGVVCYNDDIAYQLIGIADKRGIRIPEDLSVTGIDDSVPTGIKNISLTSVPHPKELLGRKVAGNMLAMIEDPCFDGNFLFDAEPVLRDSVRTIRDQDTVVKLQL